MHCTLKIHTFDSGLLDGARKSVSAAIDLQLTDVSVLLLSEQLKPDLVLTDDLALRQVLEQRGRVPMGSIGLVMRAYSAGLWDRDRAEQTMDALFTHSTLYLSPIFRKYARRKLHSLFSKPAD
jgi:predicted nucleic acid-binding protein